MAKRSRKTDSEGTARRKLMDAQAKLQAAQERRARTVAKGDQDVEVARFRAAARTEKATRDVERRAARVARAEAKLMSVQDRRAKHAHPVRPAAPLPKASKARSRASIPPAPVEELRSPAAVADELALLAAPQVQVPDPDSDEIVTATSTSEIDALIGAEARALETLKTQFSDQGATFTEWLTASGISRKTFLRARKALVDRGLAHRDGNGPGARYIPGE